MISTFSNTLHEVMTTIPKSPTLAQTFETLRITSQDLESYPELSTLTDLINNTFTAAGRQYPGLYDAERKRFEKPSDFLEELGPSGVSFITFALDGEFPSGKAEIVATTSYKPFESLSKGSHLRDELEAERRKQGGKMDPITPTTKSDVLPGFDAKLEQEPQPVDTMSAVSKVQESHTDALKVAVSFVAVAPAWQKHGLASRLLNTVVDEVHAQAIAQGRKDFTLVLDTMKEINGSYWTSKGFETVEEDPFPAGSFGSKSGFTMSRMSRNHVVN